MRNIHITELMSKRNTPVFNRNSSLKDLVVSLRDCWKINQFYLTDDEGNLVGILTKNHILEYLCPVYLTIDMFFSDSMNDKLEKVSAFSLVNSPFPCLTLKQNLPEVLEVFLETGHSSLPVIDSKGKLIGEVLNDSLLKALPLNVDEAAYAV